MFRKLKIRTKCAAAVRIEICATGPLERMSANPGSPFEMNAPFAELDSIVNGFIFGVQPELSSELDAPPPPPPPPPPAPLPSRKRKMSAVEMGWGGDATRPIATWDASEVPSWSDDEKSLKANSAIKDAMLAQPLLISNHGALLAHTMIVPIGL